MTDLHSQPHQAATSGAEPESSRPFLANVYRRCGQNRTGETRKYVNVCAEQPSPALMDGLVVWHMREQCVHFTNVSPTIMCTSGSQLGRNERKIHGLCAEYGSPPVACKPAGAPWPTSLVCMVTPGLPGRGDLFLSKDLSSALVVLLILCLICHKWGLNMLFSFFFFFMNNHARLLHQYE